MDRGERLFRFKRNKEKWKKLLKYVFFDLRPHRLNRNATHGTLCSCWMCGNPRKYFKHKTIQEQKADEFNKSQEY